MDTQQRFEELKGKYAPVLRFLDASEARLQQMDVQDDKLMIRAVVSSPQMRDRILAEIEKIDRSFGDVIPDIRIKGLPNIPTTGQTTVDTAESFSHQGQQPPKANERKAR